MYLPMDPGDSQNGYPFHATPALSPYFSSRSRENLEAARTVPSYVSEFHSPSNLTTSTAAGKTTCFSTEPEQDVAEWRRKNREEWNANDVYHWIASVSHQVKFSYEDVNASAFNIDGATLLSLSQEEFCRRDSRFGDILYNALHNPRANHGGHHESQQMQSLTIAWCDTVQEESSHMDDSFEDDPYEHPPRAPHPHVHDETSDDGDRSSPAPPKIKVKRPPGRPPGARAKAKAEKKTGRLWEFIRNLLHNPEFCPSVICWEDHDGGVFRFVKSDKVAEIWGRRKNNEKMNYEKLSRAMRYYYKSQVFLPVLGRKLVYKFGPNAKGWRSDNPNFRLPIKEKMGNSD